MPELDLIVRCVRYGKIRAITGEIESLAIQALFKLINAVNYLDVAEMFDFLCAFASKRIEKMTDEQMRGLNPGAHDVLLRVFADAFPDVRDHRRYCKISKEFAEVMNTRRMIIVHFGPDIFDGTINSICGLSPQSELKLIISLDYDYIGTIEELVKIVQGIRETTRAIMVVTVTYGVVGNSCVTDDSNFRNACLLSERIHLRPNDKYEIRDRYGTIRKHNRSNLHLGSIDASAITVPNDVSVESDELAFGFRGVGEVVQAAALAVFFREYLTKYPKTVKIDLINDFQSVALGNYFSPVSERIKTLKLPDAVSADTALFFFRAFPNIEKLFLAENTSSSRYRKQIPFPINLKYLSVHSLSHIPITKIFQMLSLPNIDCIPLPQLFSPKNGIDEFLDKLFCCAAMRHNWSLLKFVTKNELTFIDQKTGKRISFGCRHNASIERLISVIKIAIAHFPSIQTIRLVIDEQDESPTCTMLPVFRQLSMQIRKNIYISNTHTDGIEQFKSEEGLLFY
jgi:hypothetical protein